GRLWQEGKLADKVATSFTSSQTPHGGQESTILALNTTLYHWGMVIVPLGYTVREVFAAGGNPYGTSYTSGHKVTGPDANALDVARYQGQRLARYASAVAEARNKGAFAVRRPSPENFRGATLRDASPATATRTEAPVTDQRVADPLRAETRVPTRHWHGRDRTPGPRA
ncbi:MAG TPA: hypothetical protein VG474_07670, partial [Solirubrobacteraceae bacterium]|nr:hypothetical protein [Solirubrobacteraceae bacterium]